MKNSKESKITRLKEWLSILNTDSFAENPSVAAGREAENFLKDIVESNLKYKGAYCYLGKRVPSKKNKRRYEIDLIVLTKKHIHILEVKNWSGELKQKGNEWHQYKNNGEVLKFQNLTDYNSDKQNEIVSFLKSKGVNVKKNFFSQKVIFMNRNIRLSKEIKSNPNIVTIQNLDRYLDTQKGTTPSERMLHSVVEFCLSSEASSIVMGGLFGVLSKDDFKKAQNALEKLRSWDKILFNGGKVLTGDLLKLNAKAKKVDLVKLSSGTKCKVKWNRSKFGGLLQALVTSSPLGKIKIGNEWIPLSVSDTVKFHSAGKKNTEEVLLRDVDMIEKG